MSIPFSATTWSTFFFRADLCGWQQWQRACEWSTRGADENVGWGWAQGSSPASVCQQTGANSFQLIMSSSFQFHVWQCLCPTGPAECHECCGNHGQAGAAFTSAQELVHSGHVRHERWRPLWRTWLAVQPTEKPQIMTSLYCSSLVWFSQLLLYSLVFKQTVLEAALISNLIIMEE